jgi:hypothetical protein
MKMQYLIIYVYLERMEMRGEKGKVDRRKGGKIV